jgi:N-terminal domain of galactosyltransferase/N-terminal region of glycosyl transferase group 7
MTVKRNLGIIVPYRDRAEHLRLFIPHIAAFFSRAAPDIGGSIHITIVEQEPGLEFNLGLMKNIGFQLCKDKCDYVCFHDVDYTPIWTDYSEPNGFSPIAWYGAERTIDPRGLVTNHNLSEFFGGAILFRKADYEIINGYSNSYWGWGYEDMDVAKRCLVENIPLVRRKGTFTLFPHVNLGYDLTGKPTAATIRNEKLFKTRFPPSITQVEDYRQTCMKAEDGLSTLKFSIVKQNTLPNPHTNERNLKIEMITVSV